jgi:hypothetical protein
LVRQGWADQLADRAEVLGGVLLARQCADFSWAMFINGPI